jgi:hypothetical protein
MLIKDDFAKGIAPTWIRFAAGTGQIEWEPGVLRLGLAADESSAQPPLETTLLSDAQIDDYHERDRRALPWRPPVRMRVRARFSHPVDALHGTAGFGFWNNPFVAGGAAVAPNAIWFFFASPPSDMALVRGVPGWGWKAAALNGGDVPSLAVAAGNLLLRIPGLERLLVRAASSTVRAAEQILTLDATAWHDYTLVWDRRLATWSVDGVEVLRTASPPTLPLGFVAWMDNQWAVMRPQGDVGFGLVSVPERQWLEISGVEIDDQTASPPF